jgi:hypothetical protein
MVIKPIYLVLDFIGNIDFLKSHSNVILSFLNTGWGTLTLVGLGIILILWEVRKLTDKAQEQPRELSVSHDLLQPTTSHEIKTPTISPVTTPISIEPVKVFEISFDYLDDSPLKHGWKLLEEKRPGSQPAFSGLPPNAPVHIGLTIKPTGWYGIEHKIPLYKRNADHLQFRAKFSADGRLYARVLLGSRDGISAVDEKWIKFYASDIDEKPQFDEASKEWSISITGIPLKAWLGFLRYSIT